MTKTTASAAAPRFAFVTMCTTDAYLPGALVVAHSLREAHSAATLSRSPQTAQADAAHTPFHTVCLVTPETLGVRSIKALRRAYDVVVGVEPLSFGSLIAAEQEHILASASTDEGANQPAAEGERDQRVRVVADRNLALLGRPDLGEGQGAALTKLHAWRLTAYDKVVFLDADTLVLAPLAHLFALSSSLAAASDVGWPDAFNSGVLVLTPSLATFEGLRQFAVTTGSWDGADQGLLNEYFGGETGRGEEGEGGGWERLSFRYNVTPSGGYTYAPAYQHYGAGIKVAHFIGSSKPWHRPSPSGLDASTSSASASPPVTNSYDTLLRRWHLVFNTYYPRPASSAHVDVIHSSRGVEIVERPFTVPTYEAVWSLVPSTSSAEATANPLSLASASVSASRAGDIEDLKAMFGPRHVDASAASEWAKLRERKEGEEGFYLSLPLDGRTSLVPPKLLPWPSAEEEETRRRERAEAAAAAQGVGSPNQGSGQGSPSGTWSPPRQTWDPARGPPPASDGSAASYQMRAPPDAYYPNVWDDPQSTPSSRNVFFNAPEPPAIPASLQREHFFDHLGTGGPDRSQVRAVFPWEESSRGKASRVFPDDAAATSASSTPASRSSSATRVWHDYAPGSSVRAGSQSPPQSAQGAGLMQQVHLAYANAWDTEPGIGRYVEQRARVAAPAAAASESSAVPPRTSRGDKNYTPDFGRRSNTNGGAVGSASRSQQQAAGVRGGPRTPTTESGSGHESDSRDGDDESSDEGGAGGAGTGTSASEVGRGYLRKAEARDAAHGSTSPRSPRHAERVAYAAGGGGGREAPGNGARTLTSWGSGKELVGQQGEGRPTGRARIKPEGR